MATEFGILIGSMLADVTYARIRADLAAVQAAELYAQDPLLRHLTAPRFRCPEVTVELPIAIDDVEDRSDGADFGGMLRSGLDVPTDDQASSALKDATRASGLDLKPDEVTAIDKAVRSELERLRALPMGARRGRRIGFDVRSVLDRNLKDILERRGTDDDAPKEEARRFGDAFEAGMQHRVGESLRQLSRVRVRANTNEVAGVDDDSKLVRLRLTISEEGLDLQVGEDGAGGLVQSITPE